VDFQESTVAGWEGSGRAHSTERTAGNCGALKEAGIGRAAEEGAAAEAVNADGK
jgi:hypothetical protein